MRHVKQSYSLCVEARVHSQVEVHILPVLFRIQASILPRRITAPVMFVVGVWLLFPLFITGPLFSEYKDVLFGQCEKNWWRVLLHVNNWVPFFEMVRPDPLSLRLLTSRHATKQVSHTSLHPHTTARFRKWKLQHLVNST